MKAKTVKRTAAKPVDRLTIHFERDANGVTVRATGSGIKSMNLGPLFLVMQWVSQNQAAAVAMVEAFTQGRLGCSCPECVRAREAVIAAGEVRSTVQ